MGFDFTGDALFGIDRFVIDNLEAVMIESDEKTHDTKPKATLQLHPREK